jgi:CubicO group peptidase (beta-lactamase class C family)
VPDRKFRLSNPALRIAGSLALIIKSIQQIKKNIFNVRKKTGGLFLILFLISLYCQAQPSMDKLIGRVDSLANSEIKKGDIPGLSIIVVKNGNIDYVKGYGFANLEHNVPVKPETIFQSGSVGKQFTAFAIMLLVEDGKLSLDDRLSKFFPDAPSSWDAITVKNLLTHTAGFERDYDVNLRADYTEDSLYQVFKKVPLKFAAGEKSEYSNMGYATLGFIISKVNGKFYGEFLKQRIFEPLGMSTARVISESDIVPNRAAGYEVVDGQLKNHEWVSPSINTLADGSLYVTALDMAKWEAALNAQKLLKKESYEMMWSPVKLNDGTTHPYGFGWRIDSIQGQKLIAHDGNWQGFSTTIKRYPLKKTTVVVFANLKRANTNIIATRILELYHPELGVPRLKPIPDTEPKTTALVKDFVIKQIDQKLTEDMFTPEFWKEMLPYFEQASNYLKKQGTFEDLKPLFREDLDNGNRLHHYRLYFSKETLELLITITKDNKIVMLEGRE